MLADIQAFVAVVENSGFSKGSKKLGCSTPVVTRRIARLEQVLGTRLLQRNTRQVSVTEAGAIFYENAKEVLQHVEASIKQVKNLSNHLVGTLKIGLPHSISKLHVTPALKSFLAQYPDLHVHIVTGNHLLDLLSSRFDLIIHCGELKDNNFYYKKLGDWTKVTYASPDYLKIHGTPQHPQELVNFNCLDYYDNFDHSWKYLIKGKNQLIPVSGNIRVNSSMDLKNLAVSGLGIVYLPSFTVKKDLKEGKLVPILDSFQPKPLSMYAVYPSNKYLNAKLKLFIEFLMSLKMVD